MTKTKTKKTDEIKNLPMVISNHSTETGKGKTYFFSVLSQIIKEDAELESSLGRTPVVHIVEADERSDTNSHSITQFVQNFEYGESLVAVIEQSELPTSLTSADVLLFDTNGGAGKASVEALKELTGKLHGTVLTFAGYSAKSFEESMNRHNELRDKGLKSIIMFTEVETVTQTYLNLSKADLKKLARLMVGKKHVLNAEFHHHNVAPTLFAEGVLPNQKKSDVDNYEHTSINDNVRHIWNELRTLLGS